MCMLSKTLFIPVSFRLFQGIDFFEAADTDFTTE